MHEHLAERGWQLEVWFMARSEPRRDWSFSEGDFAFPHRFLRGLHFGAGSVPLHFNPEVLRLLRRIRPDILLVAGGWVNPTVWLAGASSAARKKMFWSESHLASIQNCSRAARAARRFALSRFNQFVVPGILAEEYIRHHTSPTRIRRLPNIVNPTTFRDKVATARSRVTKPFGNKRMLLISARLCPEKGLLQFLGSLEQMDAMLRGELIVCIAGAGPLLPELQQWTATRSVAVWLLGHQSESEMVELYAQADGFCLPSISDPNPLSVIEAMWAGLPLILSSRVGNHPECLQDGKNGFLFDVFDPSSTTTAISRWLELSPKELSAFGNRSSQIAHEEFAPDQVIEAFLNELIPPIHDPELLPKKRVLQQLSSTSSPKSSSREAAEGASLGKTRFQARH